MSGRTSIPRIITLLLTCSFLAAACTGDSTSTAEKGSATTAPEPTTTEPAPIVAIQLVHFDPVGVQERPDQNPLPATATGVDVTVSDLENVTHGVNSGNNADVRPTLMSVGPLDETDSFYVKFTVTPDDPALGVFLSTLSYDYRSYFGGATGTISLRTSADAFTTTVDAQDWAGGTAPATVTLSFDASSVPVVQGPLEVRLYMHDLLIESPNAADGADWADLVSSELGGKGLQLHGGVVAPGVPFTTTAAPAPTTDTQDDPETNAPDRQEPQRAATFDRAFLADAADKIAVSDGAFLFAVVDQNGDVIEGANGADANGNQPTASDTFRIGSITKVFTSLATLSLVEDGDVDLDAPASTYVSRVSVPDEVTVRDLLQHTSGIYNVTDAPGFFDQVFETPERVWLLEEQLELIADRPSLFEPGSQFRYSNTNFVILGSLLEEVSGQPYHEIIRERIIAPLGLSSTYVAGFEDGPGLFDPYDHEGDVNYDYTSIASVAWSAGGMVSSAQDLHTLFTALFDEEIVSATMIEMMTDDAEYGFGVELAQWDQGLIGHSGGIPGYFTLVRHSPETGVTAFLALTDEQADPSRAVNAMFNGFAGNDID